MRNERVVPPDHPLARHMAPWPHLNKARRAWRVKGTEGVLAVENYWERLGFAARARVPGSTTGYTDCFVKAASDLIAWVNLACVAEFPTYGMKEAPIVATAALNCLPPGAGNVLWEWMRLCQCRPALTRPVLKVTADGADFEQAAFAGEEADVFLTPELAVTAHCLLEELPDVALRLARLQVDWCHGDHPAVRYDAYGVVVPEVWWTPVALEVYEAWQTIKGAMDVGQWAMALYKGQSKVHGHTKRFKAWQRPGRETPPTPLHMLMKKHRRRGSSSDPPPDET